ncbi:MAG: hypothetical protein IJR29_03740 [Butyrivibrio sp.]|nr:hypothetical protein [Butyrivibrio sp.]
MKKQPEPNLQLILKSAIWALQVTYKDYKTAIIKDLQFSWYSDNGDFTFLAGAEERKKKIADLGKEVVRLKVKVEEIKNEIKAKEKSEPQESEG